MFGAKDIEEELLCKVEKGNPKDPYAVALLDKKASAVVGHVRTSRIWLGSSSSY